MYEQPVSIASRVTLRPVSPDDESFLQELYFKSRDDLAGLFDDEVQQRNLLMIQYLGQKHSYSHEFPNADDDVVLLDGKPVGRLLIDRNSERHFGVDILLLPETRTLGIGTVLLNRLFNECSERGVPFRLSVTKGNPAIRLYERLGCRVEGENATHLIMVWNTNEGPAPQ